MALAPLQRANLVDQAYQAIKELIIGGELPQGGQLNIDSLARRLGVSNSPIREALRRLEYQRWVETIPFRGAFVRPLDAAEMVELYETRQIIELAALRKLMQGLTGRGAGAASGSSRPGTLRRAVPASDGLKTLRGIVAEIEAAVRDGDPMAYLRSDTRFHQAIVDLAGNRRLADFFQTLVEQGRSFMLGRTPEAMARCREEPEEHAQLLELIERGDRRGACRLLCVHLRISLEDIQPQPDQKQEPGS